MRFWGLTVTRNPKGKWASAPFPTRYPGAHSRYARRYARAAEDAAAAALQLRDDALVRASSSGIVRGTATAPRRQVLAPPRGVAEGPPPSPGSTSRARGRRPRPVDAAAAGSRCSSARGRPPPRSLASPRAGAAATTGDAELHGDHAMIRIRHRGSTCIIEVVA